MDTVFKVLDFLLNKLPFWGFGDGFKTAVGATLSTLSIVVDSLSAVFPSLIPAAEVLRALLPLFVVELGLGLAGKVVKMKTRR